MAAVFALWALLAPPIRADVFKLKNGESFEGEVLIEKTDKYWVRMAGGAKWIVRADIAEHVRIPSPRQRYEGARKKFPMTAAGQFELAMWCGENNLAEEKEKHLRAAAALDPTFGPAHLALGFVREGDQWAPPRKETIEIPRRPVPPATAPTPAEKAPAKTEARDEDAERRARSMWNYNISTLYHRYLARLELEQKREGARRILAIEDPAAVDGIIDILAGRRDAGVRRLCARALGNFKSDRALLQLLVMALTDSNDEVAEEARAALNGRGDHRVPELLRKGLEGPEELLQRCAESLGALQDFDSVPALIDLLSGRPRLSVDEYPDAMVAFWRLAHKTLTRGALIFEPEALLLNEDIKAQLGGRSGAVGKKVQQPHVRPPDKFRAVVQEALQRITDNKENFGYHKVRWAKWYEEKKAGRKAS